MLLDVIGDTWLSFTTTASDQVHIDVSRDEVLRATNLGNLLSPVIAILFANSPVCAGNPSGFRSSRQGLMGQIHQASFRHGITARPVTSFRDWIQLTAEQEFLIRKENDTYLPVSNMTFVEYADRHTATFDDFLMHDHYIWNSLRPRTAHGTVEWRAACQQPWSSHMTVSAFGLGCIEAMDELEQWLTSSLGDELWPAMQAYEKASLTEGPSAKEPFPGMIQGILERCAQGLTSRGFGEEQYLAPLFEHTRNQHHPAASALEAFADNGVEGLINWANINPKSKG
jgi:gamma-glutamylcysteine synthetase